MLTNLDHLRFDNRFVAQLAADPDQSVRPRQVFNACYSLVSPSPVKQATLIAYSPEVALQLNLSPGLCQSQAFADTFVGNRALVGMQSFAMCYGGHQFGNWAGQLGDGRAINLGEVMTNNGQYLTLQLKGAGLTPYSRTADGLAVLRSSIREFLCSEAMFHLGVPTTRALSLVLTGERVVRDMFYDGNPQLEPTAVVCRVAPSFIRFGNFQLFSARGDTDNLKKLVDFTITTEFSDLGEPCKAVYLQWFKQICDLTATMVAHWMRVGFVHGVMNTDNMSISGLTIDYGPYGWLEDYDPGWTPNTTDAQGKRYCYGNQPKIAQWNLYQLANAIVPLIGQTEDLEQILQDFVDVYHQQWLNMLAAKIGLAAYVDETDHDLLDQLLTLLPLVETDMTLFFRKLADVERHKTYEADQLLAVISDAYYQPEQLDATYRDQMGQWLSAYQARIAAMPLDDAARKAQMNQVNPKYVLRNYLAQEAIDLAHTGDYSRVNELLTLLKKPYDDQPEFEHYAAKRPDWARVKAGCSMLSCSS